MNKGMFALLGLSLALIAAPLAEAAKLAVTIHSIDDKGTGQEIGTVTVEDADGGLKLTPSLKGLPAGPHGFHVHQNPDCGAKEKDGKMVPGLAAGGHWDPEGHGKHAGPQGMGHKGDLPVLEVGQDGMATKSIVAPRLKTADLKGRSLMIHAGGDNYSDDPKPLGGGGARIACGVIR